MNWGTVHQKTVVGLFKVGTFEDCLDACCCLSVLLLVSCTLLRLPAEIFSYPRYTRSTLGQQERIASVRCLDAGTSVQDFLQFQLELTQPIWPYVLVQTCQLPSNCL